MTTTRNSALQSLYSLRAAIDDHLERLMRIECDDPDAVNAITAALDHAEKARASACKAICAFHGLKPGDRVKFGQEDLVGTVKAISKKHGTVKVQWDGRDWIWHDADALKRL